MDPTKFSKLHNDMYQARDSLDHMLLELFSEMPTPSIETINSVMCKGSHFFTIVESFVSGISSTSEELSKIQIEDVLNTIESVFEYAIQYYETMKESIDIQSVYLEPESNFLKTAQLIYKSYRKSKALSFKEQFQQANLPIVGFESKGSFKLNSLKIDRVSLSMGLILLILSGSLVFFIDINTGMKYLFLRVVISLSIAFIFTGVAKEKIQAKIKIPGIAITTTGTIATFLIIYFCNPAEIPVLS